MIAAESSIAPEVLSSFHQRRLAGESLKVLAGEANPKPARRQVSLPGPKR